MLLSVYSVLIEVAIVQSVALQILLGVSNKADPFVDWDNVFDLEEQASIRRDCQEVAGMRSSVLTVQTSNISRMTVQFHRCICTSHSAKFKHSFIHSATASVGPESRHLGTLLMLSQNSICLRSALVHTRTFSV